MIWVQLPLFVVPRCYRYGDVDLRREKAPENPWLAWGLHLAHTMAEARGISPHLRSLLNRTLIMLLAEHRDGELIRSSDFHGVLRDRKISTEHISEVLERMGVLLDDRPATFEKWLAVKLDGLAPGIRSETERWVRALHDGGPRSPARDPDTTRKYLRLARPALLEWSARYQHLREVTREDILAHVDRLHGRERRVTLVALRSLFAWAKKNDVIFGNPTSQIKGGHSITLSCSPCIPTSSLARSRRPPHHKRDCSSRSRPCTPPGPERSAPYNSMTLISPTAA